MQMQWTSTGQTHPDLKHSVRSRWDEGLLGHCWKQKSWLHYLEKLSEAEIEITCGLRTPR